MSTSIIAFLVRSFLHLMVASSEFVRRRPAVEPAECTPPSARLRPPSDARPCIEGRLHGNAKG